MSLNTTCEISLVFSLRELHILSLNKELAKTLKVS